ncbi:MAG: beta-glucuronidase [Ruminococcaceae bacterium]|nr:beta-glucuronidase [Oscillospiraceae bacterium]
MLYPRLNEKRALIDLSGIWNFRLGIEDEPPEEQMGAPLSQPMSIAVPASYNDQYAGEAFRDHYGWVLYQRTVSLPAILAGERLVLRFGAVTQSAKVYLNGKLLTTHKGGFLPFESEVTDILQPGDNLLTVAVDNRVNHSTLPVGSEKGGNMLSGLIPDLPGVTPKKQNYPNFDFFNYCGINRPVKLYTTPKSYIKDITLVPSVQGENADVSYCIDTIGKGDISLIIRDEAGNTVATATGAESSFVIRNVQLWEPLNAYLYTAEVRFGDDLYYEPFGVRTVEVRGTEFLINGKPFYFKGFGKHEDAPFHGRGLNETLNVKDIGLIRWIGANSFRTSHYPYSEEMMLLCDREGIVVIDETPAVGVNLNFGAAAGGEPKDTYKELSVAEHHREVIKEMICRDKNRACVVMWSIANESDTTTFPDSALEYYKPLYDLAHSCDPQNRPVTLVGVQNDFSKDKTLPIMDVICLNRYYGWYVYGGDLKAAAQALKIELDYWSRLGKPLMFTEYGADTVAGLHTVTPSMFSEEYQKAFYEMTHAVTDGYDFFIGEQVWNFADFATVQGIMRVDGNKKGIFTRDRRPKLAAHYFRHRWQEIPDFGYKNKGN